MTLPEQLGDREYQKFVETADGKVAVRQGPNAIVDEEGNALGIDDVGRAQTYDPRVHNELKTVTELLQNILIQLEMMNT
jgi:hypothetical protein